MCKNSRRCRDGSDRRPASSHRIGWAASTRDMGRWLAEGRLQSRERVVKGIETFPETLLMLFDGSNQGKLVIEV